MRKIFDVLANLSWNDFLEDGRRVLDIFCWIGIGYAAAVIVFQGIRYFMGV